MDNNISKVIREKRMTQADLARLVGINRAYINRIIHKKITPTIPMGMRIANALGVSLDDLFILEKE